MIVVLCVVVVGVVVVVVFSSSGATYHSLTTCNAITMHCCPKYARQEQRRGCAGVVWQSRALGCNDQYEKGTGQLGLSPLTGKSGLSHTNGDRRFCVHVTHILSCAGQYGCTKCNLCRCANVLYKSNCSQKLAATRSVLNNVQRMQVDVQGWLYNVLCWRSRGHNLGHIFHTQVKPAT